MHSDVPCLGAKHAFSLHPNNLIHSLKKKLINVLLHLPLPRSTYKTAGLLHLPELRNKNTKFFFVRFFSLSK